MNTLLENPLLHPQHPRNVLSAYSGQQPDQCPQTANHFWQDDYQIEDPRVVRRLVNNLMYLFNIQPGDYLTFVLGYGHCRSNEQALQYWVLDQLSQNPTRQDEVLSVLVEALKEQLNLEVYS